MVQRPASHDESQGLAIREITGQPSVHYEWLLVQYAAVLTRETAVLSGRTRSGVAKRGHIPRRTSAKLLYIPNGNAPPVYIFALMPPSTGIIAPVTKRASSEQSQVTRPATSSG